MKNIGGVEFGSIVVVRILTAKRGQFRAVSSPAFIRLVHGVGFLSSCIVGIRVLMLVAFLRRGFISSVRRVSPFAGLSFGSYVVRLGQPLFLSASSLLSAARVSA